MVKLGGSSLQDLIEIIDSLSTEDQMALIEMIRQRINQQRWDEIAKNSNARLKAILDSKGESSSFSDPHINFLNKP
jgi:hypothetical protein